MWRFGHVALVAAALFLCLHPGARAAEHVRPWMMRVEGINPHSLTAAGQSSTVANLTTNTTNPIPAGSCLYVDQGPGTDTKLCSNYVQDLLGGSAVPVGSGGTGLGSVAAGSLLLGNGTANMNVLSAVNGDCVVGSGGVWTAGACGGGGVSSVGLSVGTSIFTVGGSPITGSGTLTLTPDGTSGGIPYFSSNTTMQSTGALTAGEPLIGGGAGSAPSSGTKSGSTTEFATVSGSTSATHCAAFNSTGDLVDNGGPCGSGGTGTVTSVGLSVPASSIFAVTPATITSSGTFALTTTGTSGAIPYFSSSSQLSSSGALGANLPVIGGGAGAAPTVGSRSGNTTEFATVAGTLSNGDCVDIDASGNFKDAGAACGTGSGGGGGSFSATLGPGLATTLNTYNAGTQTLSGTTETLAPQIFYTAESTTGTDDVAASDTARVWTATVSGVTFAVVNPGTVGGGSYMFGYDGTHPYSLTTVGGTADIYGCGTTATTISNLTSAIQVLPDGSNYECLSGGSGAGGGGPTSPVYYPIRNVAGGSTITVNTSTDYMIVVEATAALAVDYTCPASPAGYTFVVKDGLGNDGTDNITLTPGGGKTVDGAATLVMEGSHPGTTPYEERVVTCDGNQNSWVN